MITMYANYNNIPTKVTKAYVGINNVPILFYEANSISLPEADGHLWRDGSDEDIQNVLTAYYSGQIDSTTLNSYFTVGDIRTASDDQPMMQVGSHTARFYNNSWGIYTLPKQTTIKWVIIGIEHDDLADGSGKAAITIQTLGYISSAANSNNYWFQMNSSNTNSGGWSACALRTYLNGTFKDNCGFSDIVKTVKKPTCNTYSSTTLTNVEDTVFLLSELEVFGSHTYSPNGAEGAKYSYFTTSSGSSEKIKKLGWEASGGAYFWWLRSCNSSYATGFCIVDASGDPDYYGASNDLGLAPAACL